MFSSNTSQVSSGGYEIQRSLRFNSADSAYLNRTPASASNRKTWTWSGWIKLTKNTSQQYFFGGTQDNYNVLWTLCSFYQDKIYLQSYSGGFQFNFETTQVFRDYSAWYHIVVAVDTTQATDSNRLKLYVNGNLVTSYVTASYPSQNADTLINGNWLQTISGSIATTYLDGYMTEVNFIDGQALTPSSFGAFDAQTGVWGPTPYAGSYGTNGFYLNFSDNSNTTAATLGKDYSGNSNNWTPNNFSVSAGAGNDSLVDVPTNWGTDTGVGGTVRGNYCTWNPLTQSSGTASNGNLQYYGPNAWKAIASTFLLPSTGKWFAEVVLLNAPLSGNFSDMWNGFGVIAPSAQSAWSYNSGTSFFISDTGHYSNYSTGSTGNFAGNTTGTVLGLAFDRDTNQITVYQDGVSKATVTVGVTSGSDLYFFNGSYSATYGSMAVNFGQRPFAYTAPSGFKALNTQNLPTPTIGATTTTQANKYFDVVLRNGGGSSGGTYSTTVNMANGALLWDKPRNSASSNYLVDSVRGISKNLRSNTIDAESTDVSWFTGFNSSSFTTGSSDWGSSTTVVDWIWAANGAGVTNTQGTITSTVSANTTSGFSVVTWTQPSLGTQTIGHGLGVAPKMIIVKSRTSTESWAVYHASLGATKALLLNGTDAAITSSAFWNDTAPTSTVFSKFNGAVNLVAYCFAEVPGYSKFGSYTGNGSADGPFVFCGFRPAYVMVKCSSASENWHVLDNKRNTANSETQVLFPNLSNAEVTGASGLFADFTANGFKIRENGSAFNTNGATYIFMAVAEAPQKFALAR